MGCEHKYMCFLCVPGNGCQQQARAEDAAVMYSGRSVRCGALLTKLILTALNICQSDCNLRFCNFQ